MATRIVATALLLLALVTAALTLETLAARPAAAAQPFSADMVIRFGEHAHSEKIYVADGKVRMDAQDGRGGILIALPARQTAFLLDTRKKIYAEMAFMGRIAAMILPADPGNPCAQWRKLTDDQQSGAGWNCRQIGTETLNGRRAVKFEGSSAKGEKGALWVDPRLRAIIKTRGNDTGMELRNIREGPQPASLFAIPRGYKKVDPRQIMPAKPAG